MRRPVRSVPISGGSRSNDVRSRADLADVFSVSPTSFRPSPRETYAQYRIRAGLSDPPPLRSGRLSVYEDPSQPDPLSAGHNDFRRSLPTYVNLSVSPQSSGRSFYRTIPTTFAPVIQSFTRNYDNPSTQAPRDYNYR